MLLDNLSSPEFWFYKLIKSAVFPLTWIWICMLATAVLLFCRQTVARGHIARITSALGAALLYAFSTPPVSANLAAILEQAYPPFEQSRGAAFDAIVVLTGDLSPKAGMRPVTELNFSTLQRTICGVDAYLMAVAPKLLLSGGATSGLDFVDAREMALFAKRLSVPDHAMVLEESSRNTYESAKEVRRILGARASVLLVTSAMHLPRAMRLFETQGLRAAAYPCGYQTALKAGTWPGLEPGYFIPSTLALARSTAAINEFVGLLVYRLAGKL